MSRYGGPRTLSCPPVQREIFHRLTFSVVNEARSYLYEPAHSVHTLTVAPDAKEDAVVNFIIFGSNVNVDEKGDVVSILDAQKVYGVYQALCEAEGKNCDATIVMD